MVKKTYMLVINMTLANENALLLNDQINSEMIEREYCEQHLLEKKINFEDGNLPFMSSKCKGCLERND